MGCAPGQRRAVGGHRDVCENLRLGPREVRHQPGVEPAIGVVGREIGDIREQALHQGDHQPHDRQRGRKAGGVARGGGGGRHVGGGSWLVRTYFVDMTISVKAFLPELDNFLDTRLRGGVPQTDKNFLLLFSKKEALASYPNNPCKNHRGAPSSPARNSQKRAPSVSSTR